MDMNRSAEAPFNQAADRRAHELARLSKEERAAYERQVVEHREKGEADKELRREQQRQRYEQDLADARERIRAERQTTRPRPSGWWRSGDHRLTPERLEELAARKVEANNKAELAKIDQRVQRQIDHEWNLILFHHPEFQQERESVQALREQKHRDKEVTRVFDNGPDGDRGRHRGR
jgi:hypothetical protein